MRAPEFWRHGGAVASLLAPLGALYGANVAWKAKHARPQTAPVPVICVGNLTAGGSGKTPIALAIARMLLARGRKPYFLTRGYGGRKPGPVLVREPDTAADVGDEALLLAQIAPTIVARERARGAALACADGAGVIIMDDGHQNFSLRKSLSLVVVDGETGFGNGRMIPAGPLREPVAQGLARADAVIVMGSGMPELEGFSGPVLRARLSAKADSLRGGSYFAFAGIGRPEKFVTSLKAAGASVAGTRFFPDHHPYRKEDIAALRAAAGDAGLITTQKDFVRLLPSWRGGIAVLPVEAVFDDPAQMDGLLDRLERAL